MKNNTSKSNNIGTGTLLALGAGVAALATTSYYFFGPKGKTHRGEMRGWMIKMKGEIIERIEDVKELTEPVYQEIVDSVAATYAATTRISREELQAFTDRLKSQWSDIVFSSKARNTKARTRRTKKSSS